jgi:tetratricopeptide (TPR) repeat protein
VRKAATYFQQAIENDPTYAAAYSGLADCLFMQGFYGYGRPRDLMPRAKAYALKALELNPLLCEAHCSLALLENAWEWNSRECGRLLRWCLELNPNYATAIAKYATSYLSYLDRYEEASAWLSRALVLDPLSPNIHADLAINFALRGLDELFEQEAARVLEMDPAMLKLYWFQMRTRGARGNWPGAVEAAECALRHMPEDPVTLGFAAAAYAGLGNARRAAELLGKLESLSQVRYVPYAPLAYAHEEPGGEEAFFRLMKQATEERSTGARTLRRMRRFNRFASDSRYDALLEEVGLSDQDVAQAAAVDLAG